MKKFYRIQQKQKVKKIKILIYLSLILRKIILYLICLKKWIKINILPLQMNPFMMI